MKTIVLFIIAMMMAGTITSQTKALQRGDAGVPIYSFPQEEYSKSDRKYVGISGGFDFQNAFWGGKKNDEGVRRNTQAFDAIARLLYGRGSIEAGAFVEYFHQIGYTAVGLDFNYVGRIWNDIGLIYVGGPEFRFIWRESGILFPPDGSLSYSSSSKTFGFNNRLRIENIFSSRFGVEWLINYSYRADVRDLAENNLMDEPVPAFKDSFSSYFMLIYYF